MIRPLAVLALCSLALPSAAQDLAITFKSSEGGTSTHYYTKDKVRTNNGRNDSIVEFSSGKITTIDNQKKTYSEMTIAEMEEAMNAAKAQMDERMAKVPPQMRDQVAKMMGGAAADVTVTKGATKTIAGYSCQDFTVVMSANMTMETCNSTAIAPPFDPANYLKLARISVPMVQGMDKLITKMQEIKGIALATHTTISMMGNKKDISMEATEVKKGALPAGAFDIPADYKKVDSPLKAMAKGGR